jgi:outer membrane protein OmpA-like peptidoglycan-associated protein
MAGQKREKAMRFQTIFALATAAALGFSYPAQSQDDPAGVTDFTTTRAQSIEEIDIIEALAPTRGTRIEAGAPPTVRLPIYFEFDSTQLKPEAVILLGKVGAALSAEELASFNFSVEGHTDSIGPAEYNDGLSARRADAVRSFLVNSGVPDTRLETVGRGEAAPVAANDSDQGRQRNRRVELINLGVQP